MHGVHVDRVQFPAARLVPVFGFGEPAVRTLQRRATAYALSAKTFCFAKRPRFWRLREFLQNRKLPQLMEDMAAHPLLEIIVQGAAGAKFLWSGFPLAAGAKDIENAIGRAAQIVARSSALWGARVFWQKRRHAVP